MTTGVENTIYKFSNMLWGGHLASSTSSSRLYPQSIFLTHSGEAIFDFARNFFVFIGQKYKPSRRNSILLLALDCRSPQLSSVATHR